MSLLNSRYLTAVQRYDDEGIHPSVVRSRCVGGSYFADLLQEVRVVLIGVQLLFGFLLTLAVSDEEVVRVSHRLVTAGLMALLR
jgi:hypothetical protein